MDWYILKVQSNRERSIADALERQVAAIEGLEKYVDVDGSYSRASKGMTEFKGGKKKIVERQLFARLHRRSHEHQRR